MSLFHFAHSLSGGVQAALFLVSGDVLIGSVVFGGARVFAGLVGFGLLGGIVAHF